MHRLKARQNGQIHMNFRLLIIFFLCVQIASLHIAKNLHQFGASTSTEYLANVTVALVVRGCCLHRFFCGLNIPIQPLLF